jgi:hypothetical protein
VIIPDIPIVRISLKDYASLANALGSTVFAITLKTEEGRPIAWRFSKGYFTNKRIFEQITGRLPA